MTTDTIGDCSGRPRTTGMPRSRLDQWVQSLPRRHANFCTYVRERTEYLRLHSQNWTTLPLSELWPQLSHTCRQPKPVLRPFFSSQRRAVTRGPITGPSNHGGNRR